MSVEIARRAQVRVVGTVQGVGFRPYVYRLAAELELAGWVLNDARGVLVEVEGDADAVGQFLRRLAPESPPLAVVERTEVVSLAPLGERTFAIRESPRGEIPDAPVAPDTATCPDCLRELFDPGDRRHRYPFINCANCGPRFTIVRGIPYDRPFTTMAGFAMCDACRAEYQNPLDRRFHAQPNACPVCGPSVRLVRTEAGGSSGGAIEPGGLALPDDLDAPANSAVESADPLLAAALAIRSGAIVAVKGIGGFHLACRADHEGAVNALRARKHREDKPFALMVPTLADAAALIELGSAELGLLSQPARPIVLATRLPQARVAEAVAPGARELGVMLPYSPLHHLLLADAGAALVMTSGNVSDEPIAYTDEDALERLSAIADLVLLHDRPIETRTDDSVVRALTTPDGVHRPMFLRRSRGYVPASIPLPEPATRPILACGAELKSTFCLARGSRAWVSHHIGDLHNYETLCSFTDGISHFERLFDLDPQVIVHDLHPEYLSTKYALDRGDTADGSVDADPTANDRADGGPAGGELVRVGVQHHHAHLAACLAEHGVSGPAVGAIFDGTGYGTDGTVWGGELLAGDVADAARVGSLMAARLPGGERAIREPWRMACAWLITLDGTGASAPSLPPALQDVVNPRSWELVAGIARTGVSSPVTTSMGRLLDAAAALTGIRSSVNYEGQAAIEFEAACDPTERGSYEIAVAERGRIVLDPREALRALLADVAAGVSAAVVATRFHTAVANATVRACALAACAAGTDVVVLSGGVFQNRRLVQATTAGLYAAGLRPLVPERLPPGDGGISYGQAAVAAARIARGSIRLGGPP